VKWQEKMGNREVLSPGDRDGEPTLTTNIQYIQNGKASTSTRRRFTDGRLAGSTATPSRGFCDGRRPRHLLGTVPPR